MKIASTGLTIGPPLRVRWENGVGVKEMVVGSSAIYGITFDGKIVSMDATTGKVRWKTQTTYLRQRLTVRDNTLFAYRKDDGLTKLQDNGTSYTEKLLVSINPATESDPLSNIAVDDFNIYMAINQALIILNHDGGLVTGAPIGSQVPHMVVLTAPKRCVVVDGRGQPQMFAVTADGASKIWHTLFDSPGTSLSERTAFAGDGLIVTSGYQRTTVFNAATGAIKWHTDQISAAAVFQTNGRLLLVGANAEIAAANPQSGEFLWRRAYLYPTTALTRVGATETSGRIYLAASVANGGPTHLFSVNAETGGFEWQANPAVSGLPIVAGGTLITYGSTDSVRAHASASGQVLTSNRITWTPNPLRGHREDFSGRLTIEMPTQGVVTVTAIREAGGGRRLLDRKSLSADQHGFDWDAGEALGFSDASQFGRFLVDVTDGQGNVYTQAKLVPVNTLPDIIGHWAKQHIETMLFLKYIGGYPDLTFLPDNLITRAECSSIVAKTLNLNGPSAGFRTKFTDITNHWAQQPIMALEEKDIIGGFLEDDGTYTFRPGEQMTRAQQARILVRAYEILPAPPEYQTNFTDISNHWARMDIEALESSEYVTGFREPNGTFTYRPERHLTRAELCTVVVRIRKLSR